MTTISHPKCTLVTQSVFVDDPVSDLRNIDSFGSILQVCAAPFSDLNRMMTTVSRQAYVAYLIDAAKIYTGHGNGNRNIGERLKPEELKQAQVYVIYSLDPRYDKRVASYVEARLIDVAYELGVPLANSNRPFGRNGLRICPNQEQLVVHARFLLAVAGFRRFEDARQDTTSRPARVAATADLHDAPDRAGGDGNPGQRGAVADRSPQPTCGRLRGRQTLRSIAGGRLLLRNQERTLGR
jgi:hypothetical protein